MNLLSANAVYIQCTMYIDTTATVYSVPVIKNRDKNIV